MTDADRARRRTTADIIDKAFDWAKQGRAVITYGKVVSTPKALTIPRPDQLQPLDELFAPGIPSPFSDLYWGDQDPPSALS